MWIFESELFFQFKFLVKVFKLFSFFLLEKKQERDHWSIQQALRQQPGLSGGKNQPR